MSWRERARSIVENGGTSEPTKPTKPPFVSFGCTSPGPSLPVTNPGPLFHPKAQARRQRVLELLATNRGTRYALVTDLETDPEVILLTLAIRGRATCELRIPGAKYDAFLLLNLIDRHAGTVH
jgi:hypothetical protein